MDNRESLDRSSLELVQTNTALNTLITNDGGGSFFGGESPKGQQSAHATIDQSPAVESVLQSDVRCLKT